MKGLPGHPSLCFTICLLLVLLLCSSPARAQNAEDRRPSQAPQTVQTSAPHTDTTTGKQPGNPDLSFDASADPNYILGSEDVVQIDVFDVPELSKLVLRVAADGLISLPLIGRVQAAGLTTEQFRQELAEKWGENYLQDPQVTVFVKEFKAKPVSVIGAVE